MARPSKLTPDLEADFLEALRFGAFIDQACDLVGISRTTYYSWRKAAEAATDPSAERFMKNVRIALACAEYEAQSCVHNEFSLRGNWKAAAWYLQHRHPERWGGNVPSPAIDAASLAILQAAAETVQDIGPARLQALAALDSHELDNLLARALQQRTKVTAVAERAPELG